MKLTLTRLDVSDKGIFGHLTCDSSPFNCVTLENHVLYIPAGTYSVKMRNSIHFKRQVPGVENVPDRSDIEIHMGNYETASKGCILVGETRDGVAIDNSVKTLDKLCALITGWDDVCLTIK